MTQEHFIPCRCKEPPPPLRPFTNNCCVCGRASRNAESAAAIVGGLTFAIAGGLVFYPAPGEGSFGAYVDCLVRSAGTALLLGIFEGGARLWGLRLVGFASMVAVVALIITKANQFGAGNSAVRDATRANIMSWILVAALIWTLIQIVKESIRFYSFKHHPDDWPQASATPPDKSDAGQAPA